MGTALYVVYEPSFIIESAVLSRISADSSVSRQSSVSIGVSSTDLMETATLAQEAITYLESSEYMPRFLIIKYIFEELFFLTHVR